MAPVRHRTRIKLRRRRRKGSSKGGAAGSLYQHSLGVISRNLAAYSSEIALLPAQLAEQIIWHVVAQLRPRQRRVEEKLFVVCKVRVVDDGRVLTMRLRTHDSVLTSKRAIWQKLAEQERRALHEYALFQPYGSFSQPRWLRDELSLAVYDLRPGDELEMTLKKTLLRSKFLSPWETIKTFEVDATHTVYELSTTLARRLGVCNADEFGLKLQDDETGRARWLDSTLTLAEQHVDPTRCYLQLKKRYFFIDDAAMSSESSYSEAETLSSAPLDEAELAAAVHAEFCECLDAVVSATFPATLPQCVAFAALQCHVRFGAWHEGVGFDALDLRDYVPHEYVARPRVAASISMHWQKLGQLSQLAAKRKYIALVRALPTFGLTFFVVDRLETADDAKSELSQLLSSALLLAGDEPRGAAASGAGGADGADDEPRSGGDATRLLLGVGEHTVQFLHPRSKALLLSYRLSRLHQWQVCHDRLLLSFSNRHSKKGEQLAVDTFVTREAKPICELFSTYIHHQLEQRSRSPYNKPKTAATAGSSSTTRQQQQQRLRYDEKPSFRDDGRVSRARAGSVHFERTRRSGDFSLEEAARRRKKSLSLRGPLGRRRTSALYVDPLRTYLNPLAHRYNASRLRSAHRRGAAEARHYERVMSALSELSERLNAAALAEQSTCACRVLVRFLDKTEKLFFIDAGRDVAQITELIALEQGLRRCADEFSLRYRVDANDAWEWLNPYASLVSQTDIVRAKQQPAQLLFCKKFHYTEPMVSEDDPVFLNLVFCQLQHDLVRGSLVCDYEQGARLIATQFQINFGDHSERIHRPGFLKQHDLRHFCFPACLQLWHVPFTELEKLVYKEHAKLRGLKTSYAKFRYVQLCQALPLYATVLYDVQCENAPPSGASSARPGKRVSLSSSSSSSPNGARRLFLSASPPRTRSRPMQSAHSAERASRSASLKQTRSAHSGAAALVKSHSATSVTLGVFGGGSSKDDEHGDTEDASSPRTLLGDEMSDASAEIVDAANYEPADWVLVAAARAGGAAVRACLTPLPREARLGISRAAIVMHSDAGVVWQYPLSYLRSWHVRDDEAIELDFGEYHHEPFACKSPQAQQIAAYLSDYIDFLQRKMMTSSVPHEEANKKR